MQIRGRVKIDSEDIARAVSGLRPEVRVQFLYELLLKVNLAEPFWHELKRDIDAAYGHYVEKS